MKEQLLSEAEFYISRGLPIFPVHLWWNKEKEKWEKTPLIKKWQNQSGATEDDLKKWSKLSNFNAIGLVTGEKSNSVVLDIDNPLLVAEFNLPITPRVRSISGGYHYYFSYPAGFAVKSHKGLLPKVDIRADGGFIVVPPSAADEEHFYKWEITPDIAWADIPTWLHDLLEVVQSPEYVQNSFDSERLVEPGERHKTALQAIGHFSLKYRSEGLEKVWERLNDWMKSKFSIQFGQEEMTWLKKSFEQYAPKNIASETGSSDTVSSQVIKLVIDGKFSLFKSIKDKKTFIGHPNKPFVVLPVESEEFFEAISLEYYSQYDKPLMKDALKRVMPTVVALIGEKGEPIELCNRVASKNGSIYYDLFEDQYLVCISSSGVQTLGQDALKNTGVRFVRYSHQQQQVSPQLGASIADAYLLFDFLAIKDEEQKQLLLCHLAACLVPNISRCMLVLHGSRGSAKSTTMRLIHSLIDPAIPLLMRIPEKENDLQIFLEKNYFCCFDNVSGITKQVSDSLAMMITGGGTISRKLFSDKEIVTTDLKSCLALNGINLAIREPDLLERSLIIETRRLEKVRSEEDLIAEFEKVKPRILGGLFSLLAVALQNLSDQTSALFRMADYYRYASAAAVALGVSREQFEQMFQQNIDRQNEAAIESSPLALVVVDFMADKVTAVEERSAELFKLLIERAKEIGVEKSMPRGAHMLWKRLNLLKIDLEAVGITLERIPRSDATYIRIQSKHAEEVAVAAEEAADSF